MKVCDDCGSVLMPVYRSPDFPPAVAAYMESVRPTAALARAAIEELEQATGDVGEAFKPVIPELRRILCELERLEAGRGVS